MNSFTDKSHFTETAEYILENCELLEKSNCLIVDDVLYEYLEEDDERGSNHKYRFFFCCDDYDYLVDNKKLEERLDKIRAES